MHAGSDTKCKIIAVTAIDDLEITVLQAYPNPVQNQVIMTLPEQSGKVHVRIINAIGQTVWQDSNIPVAASTLSLDANYLASGTYTIHIDAANQCKSFFDHGRRMPT